MHIKELIERTGIAERQVRYLISEGFMHGPSGGRANAEYDEGHLRAIARYQRLKELGFPPAAIKLLLDSTAGVPYPVDKGITLVVSPDLIASGASVEPLAKKIERILASVLKETSNDGK